MHLPEKEHIVIIVRDILGRELTNYNSILNQGNHFFTFYSAKEMYYLFTVNSKHTSKTIKMLNVNNSTSNGGQCKIVYKGYNANGIGFKSQKDINNFVFNLGDKLQYTGYANTMEGILGSNIIVDTPQESTDYEFSILGGLRCPGIPTVRDIDGNKYNTVLMGSQCWLKENLKTTTYQNGTPIPNVTDPDEWDWLPTPAYVWWDNDKSWKDIYGALYNWHTTVDTNGLCPKGWHVPSDDEWTALTFFLGGETGDFPPHGNEIKSCRQVDSPLDGECNTADQPRWEPFQTEYGTDDYGFSGLPGGVRSCLYGSFAGIGYNANFWTTTEYAGKNDFALRRGLTEYYGGVWVEDSHKSIGQSVRCIKD